MKQNFHSQEEEPKVSGKEQGAASAVRSRTPVRLRQGAPSRTAVLLSPKTPSRTRVPAQSEAPSKAPALPKDAPSRTRIPLNDSYSKMLVSPSEALSRTLSAASSRTPGSLSGASSRTPVPPSDTSSPNLVSLSEASSRTPGPLSEVASGMQMPEKTVSSSPQVSWDRRGFWAVDAGSSQESGLPGPSEVPRIPSVSYFGLMKTYLNSDKPMNAVKGLIDVTMEVMKLDHQVKETEIQQQVVRKETEMLLNEKLPIQAATKVMLANLNYKTKEYRREIESLWSNFAQESGGETQTQTQTQPQPPPPQPPPPLQAQESASQHAEPAAELPLAAPSEQGRLGPLLKQQLEASREMSMIREKQYRELQALQEELKNARAETAAKAHARYLREKMLLQKQLNEFGPGVMGEKEKELQMKAHALEAAADRCAAELHRLLAEGKTLPNVYMPQYLARGQEERTPQSWLKIQKQHLK